MIVFHRFHGFITQLMPAFFITGTDTGVGKTWFTCTLLRTWLGAGHNSAALKPIASGDRDDAVQIHHAIGARLTLDEINPVHFKKPVAPLAAARAENRTIDFSALNHSIQKLRTKFSHFAVEGVGGWRVPLAPDYDVRAWARDLGMPVIVVARGTLGTLNHTQLTVDSIRAAGLTCAGVVVNAGPSTGNDSPDLDLARLENCVLLRELLALPVLELGRGVETVGRLPAWLGGE